MDFDISDIVASLAGHDAGRLYIVVGADSGYLSLADGKVKRLNAPKRKSAAHARLMRKNGFAPAEGLRDGTATDRQLRIALATYRHTDTGSSEEGKAAWLKTT